VEVRPGTVLIVEKKDSIVRYLRSEQIAFDDVWTPSANALAFLDAAVLRYLNTHPPTPSDDRDLRLQNLRELSTVRESLGSYVRECAGVLVAGRQQIVCQFVLRHPAVGRISTSEERSFTTIMDGGCGVFSVVADIDRREILSFGCNGVA
jgi:hypothetical protein